MNELYCRSNEFVKYIYNIIISLVAVSTGINYTLPLVQFQFDQQERDRIISIKEEEKRRATEELETWKESQRQAALMVNFS